MKLVEVVSGNQTSKETADTVYELLASIGKEPIRVKDVVGFALDRMFHIFYGEAMRLVEEGVCTPEDIDKCCVYGLGHPVGICKLLDQLGHDLMLLVDEVWELVPGERCLTSFYVDPYREIFQGHFPEDPVLPGGYTVEAAAQTADILLLSLERYRGKIPLFLGIGRADFVQKILLLWFARSSAEQRRRSAETI